MSAITVLGKFTVEPGQRFYTSLPVTTLASGLALEIPLHIIHGANPGPRLLLTATSHGNAITGLEAIRQVLDLVDPQTLCGTILAVPCQNPVAFEWDSRNTPSDMNNMNRMYPGSERGWLTEQMTAVITPLCNEADYLIDWHGGEYGCAINYTLLKLGAGPIGQSIRELGLVFGMELLYSGPPAGPTANYTGTLTDYMLSLGKPAIVAEVGTGLNLENDIAKASAQGVFNVMKHVGMYPGTPVLPKTQWIIKKRPLIRPKHGGLFYPACGPEFLNKSVPKGTLLATVRNPLTLEVLEEIHAPCEQTVFLRLRGLMTKVHPGSYAYIVGDLSTAERIDNP